MFGTIRKHQTWLWVILSIVVIVGMLNWTNQLGKNGSGHERGPGNRGTIDGRTVTDTEYLQAKTEARLMFFLRYGDWPDNGPARKEWNEERETYTWLFFTRKLEEFNIHTPVDAVGEEASRLLKQFNRGENYPLETFVDQVLLRHNVTAEDFQRFLEHRLSIQQMQSVMASAGKLVPPGEIQSLYVQSHQEMEVSPVVFAASNYLANIPEPGPALLGQYYTNNLAKYRLPDQMQVSYVFFNVTNFYPEAEKELGTNLAHDVEEDFRKIGTNWMQLGKTPEEAKIKMREYLIRGQAYTNAMEKARAFNADVATNNSLRAEILNEVAKGRGMEVKITQPFDKEYGPSDIHLPSSYPASALFNLNAESPFMGGVVQGLDGPYIIAFDKLIPSHIPLLNDIRKQVVEDCRNDSAKQLARHTGQAFAEAATNGLAQGKTFEAICSGARLTPLQIPPFSLSSESIAQIQDPTELGILKQATFTTDIGHVSQYVGTEEGEVGMVVYVRQRLPIDAVKMKAELQEFGNMVRQQRENEVYGTWFNREASTSLRDTPALKRPQDQS